MRCWRMSASLRVFWLERAQTIRWPSAEQIGAGAVCHVSSGSSVRLPGRRSASVQSGWWLCAQSRRKPSSAGSRQHGHEPSAALVQVGHVLSRGQLRVGDVEEVPPPHELAEHVPGRLMGLVVGDVAALHPEVDRHAAVFAHGEDVQELLEVRAVVLVVAPGDGRGQSAALVSLLLAACVGPAEGHGGRVVVQGVETDTELADHGEHQLGQQRRAVGVEQLVQRAADAVVVE